MSVTYPSFTNSVFPDAIDQFDLMQDVSLATLEYVQQYQNYYSNGQLQQAAQLLIDHPELNNVLINANKLNSIIDSIKCLESHYQDNIYTYIQNLVVYRGAYSNITQYNKYNVVDYTINGSVQSYMCINLNCPIGTMPTDSDYWICITLKGEKGVGIGLSFNGIWNAGITYNSDSAVTYNECLYASNEDNNIGHTPSSNSTYWTLIFDLHELIQYDNSSSGSEATNYQGAIDELYANDNATLFKLNTIESGAQINTVLGVKGSSESTYRVGNINITKDNIGLGNVDNTSDVNKNVASAVTSNYASSAGNSDAVDGYHISIGTSELTPGTSSLSTNVFYFCYE